MHIEFLGEFRTGFVKQTFSRRTYDSLSGETSAAEYVKDVKATEALLGFAFSSETEQL